MRATLSELFRAGQPVGEGGFLRYQIAVVALLVHAARVGREAMAQELEAIVRIVHERFGLEGKSAQDLIVLVSGQFDDALKDGLVTKALQEAFSAADQAEVLEMLWEVVYADGDLAVLEDALMQQIAEELGVSVEDVESTRAQAFARIVLSAPSPGWTKPT